MKKLLLTFILLVSCFGFAFATDFNISGTNEAEFVYKAAEDSLNSYFYNNLSFQANYKHFRFGMSFKANLPKYDKYNLQKDLSNDDIEYEWKDRFVEVEFKNFFAKAGKYSASFGNGLVLNAIEDDDIDVDSRLEGLYTKFSNDTFTVIGLYGALKLDNINPEKSNTVAGVDVEYYMHDYVTLGAAGAVFKNYNFASSIGKDLYIQQDVFAPRATISYEMININAEYAFSHHYGEAYAPLKGKALFADMDLYLGDFSFYSAYKNYKDFQYPDHNINGKYWNMHDLPTVNHSDEPLDENITPGVDEEGILGEIKYTSPVNMHEFVVNYAEAWSDDYKKQQSDLYAAATLNFEDKILKMELESTENVNDIGKAWKRTTTPKVSFDMPFLNNPLHLKAEYGHESQQHAGVKKYHYEPLLQADYTIGKYSVSVIAEHEFKTTEDLLKEDFWIGAELSAQIFEHTSLTLFGGKEKGGKVCRNGSCKYQAPFEGVRLSLQTNF